MLICVLSLFLLLLLINSVKSISEHNNPNYADNRTTMVHLFEWKYNDIADECERFLGPKGYGGIQVSPIQENAVLHENGKRTWYERYQPISYLMITRSGNEAQFRSMVKRCNKVGVRIYVDAVLNHMVGAGVGRVHGTGPTVAHTDKYLYPTVPYTIRDFHQPECTISNYKNATDIRNCALVGLQDLDQSKKHVREKIVIFLNKAILAGVAGIRIDAAKHMWPTDLAQIYSKLRDLNYLQGYRKGTKPFIFQEVIDSGTEAVTKSEYNNLAAVTEFQYGTDLSKALRKEGAQISSFENWGEARGMLPSSDALVFVDNHDTQRSTDRPLIYKDGRVYKAAVAFMLAHPYGMPRVMSSYEFNDFTEGPPDDAKENILSPTINADGSCGSGRVCEHRWRSTYGMVGFRNQVGNADLTNWWDNGLNQIAFCRGNRGFFILNNDDFDLYEQLPVCLPAGNYCDVISGEVYGGKCTGKTVTVDENGMADFEINTEDDNLMMAIHLGVSISFLE